MIQMSIRIFEQNIFVSIRLIKISFRITRITADILILSKI